MTIVSGLSGKALGRLEGFQGRQVSVFGVYSDAFACGPDPGMVSDGAAQTFFGGATPAVFNVHEQH